MTKEQTRMVTEVVCDIFEKFAFMFGDAVSKKELPPVESECLRADMSFSGHQVGAIALMMPTDMCREIDANVLGMDMDEDGAMQRAADAVKELLNVLCGQLLTALAGDEPVFDLSVPQTQFLAANVWPTFREQDNVLGFMVDDYPMLLSFAFASEKDGEA